MKTDIQDTMICATCRGKKVLPNPLTENVELCPTCKGRGILTNTLDENVNKGKKLLLEVR